MAVLAAPRDGRAVLICTSVLFGGLGAEVFSVAVVWLLVEAEGAAGAYYLVPQLAAAVLSGLAGVGILDRFRPLRVTLGAEVIRMVAALTAFVSVSAGVPSALLVLQGVVVAMVRPQHDAGVMAGLSRLGLGRDALRSASSLVDNTLRVARIGGPAVAALMSLLAGPHAVLLVAAVLFACALILFVALDRRARGDVDLPRRLGVRASVTRSVQLVRRSRFLTFTFASQAVNAGCWYLGFVFAVALLLSRSPDAGSGLGGFGVATLCYGVGNVVAGLAVASRPIEHPARYVLGGRALAGVGYLLLALDTGLWWLAPCAALAAAGTPCADLAFIKHVQGHYGWEDVSKLYRFKLISEYAGMLAALACAPSLVAGLGTSGTITTCGVVLLTVTAVGLVAGLHRRSEDVIS